LTRKGSSRGGLNKTAQFTSEYILFCCVLSDNNFLLSFSQNTAPRKAVEPLPINGQRMGRSTTTTHAGAASSFISPHESVHKSRNTGVIHFDDTINIRSDQESVTALAHEAECGLV
jgi:hypothetical protein